jgi:hypothetical protein
MDLLAILPYYVEIALHKDTVSLSPSFESTIDYLILSDVSSHISSLRSFVSQSCARSVCFASSVRSAITVPFCCVSHFFFEHSFPTNMRLRELSTIEVMYLSFRRSQDALLALGFFVLMVVIVFSTLLYVRVPFL